MGAVVLEAIDFGRRYRKGQRWAVRHATFTVGPGSVVALVGPNGAGKSTLLRACVGFEPADEGQLSVGGFNPRTQRERAVQAVGYVPQGGSLHRSLSIRDHFVIARSARPDFDVAHATARVVDAGLDPERCVGELSGGEQAQVALAIAAGTRARLLLLDEPLASLDPLARREFLAAFRRAVRGEGIAALVSSHIVTDIEQVADRLLLLAAGRVILDMELSEARSSFRASAEAVSSITDVGSFPGASGEMLRLTRGKEGGRPAALEEVVLGHLAAAKGMRQQESEL